MRISTQIIDNRTGDPVDAVLHDEVTTGHFLETQTQWRPVVQGATKRMLLAGTP